MKREELDRVIQDQCVIIVAARERGDEAAAIAANAVIEGAMTKHVAHLEAERATGRASLEAEIATLAIEHEARGIAGELAVQGSASVLLPFVAKQLTAERDKDGKLKIIARDEGGEAYAEGVPGLMTAFRANPKYARLVTGASQADQEERARLVAAVRGDQVKLPNTIGRLEFDGMTAARQLDFSRGGGVVVDRLPRQ